MRVVFVADRVRLLAFFSLPSAVSHLDRFRIVRAGAFCARDQYAVPAESDCYSPNRESSVASGEAKC